MIYPGIGADTASHNTVPLPSKYLKQFVSRYFINGHIRTHLFLKVECHHDDAQDAAHGHGGDSYPQRHVAGNEEEPDGPAAIVEKFMYEPNVQERASAPRSPVLCSNEYKPNIAKREPQR